MTGTVLRLGSPDAEAFAPFGRIVTPPDAAGERSFYSDSLYEHPSGSAPVLHVNRVMPVHLPLSVTKVERHPYAAQCFFPMDVASYVTLVMPSDTDGNPLPENALAFRMPGSLGVIFHPGVWHMGAAVLERPGHFVVLMWRGGKKADDVFRTIPALTLVAETADVAGAVHG